MGLQKQILDHMVPCEPYSAHELAEKLNAKRRTVDYHLRELEEKGEIEKKKHSEQRVSWWIER